jgi:hypothetical protein
MELIVAGIAVVLIASTYGLYRLVAGLQERR